MDHVAARFPTGPDRTAGPTAPPPAGGGTSSPTSGEHIEYTPGWGRHYGRAIYAHAGGIDQPTEVVRLDGNADFVVIPHRNWQGSVDMVTFTGAKYTQCGPHNWQAWRNSCYPVELPIRSSYGEPPRNDYNAPDPGPASWMGSLMEGSRDFSGLMYRRNRYLDPASGQFTQVDPIGLAGGLNLYGYANGDPVSYSDPYGLCPPLRATTPLRIPQRGYVLKRGCSGTGCAPSLPICRLSAMGMISALW